MEKLLHLIACEPGKAPDHIIQEIDDLMDKIVMKLYEIVDGVAPNIILSAFNRIHASLITNLVVEKPSAIKNAALAEARALILNIEHISKVKIFPESESGSE